MPRPDFDPILAELEAIRASHDARVKHAATVVSMVQDEIDWKARLTREDIVADLQEDEDDDDGPPSRESTEVEDAVMDTPGPGTGSTPGGVSSAMGSVFGTPTGTTPVGNGGAEEDDEDDEEMENVDGA